MRKLLLIGGFLTVAAAQEGPVIRVTTQLVQINVVVRDKNGPVKGLTKNDFELFDRGKPQNIALFQVSAESAPKPAPKLPPNLYTNRLPGAEAPRGATVILIDGRSIQREDLVFARDQMVKLLHSVPKGEMVAIYMLAHQVLVAHDFTDDPEQAIQAVKEVVSVRYLRIMEPLQLDEAFREAHGARINTGIVSIDEQMQQLEQIAYHLSRVAGRKRLIWVTAGFPLLSSVQVYPGGSPQITGATPSGGLRAGAPPPAPPMLTSTTSALDQVARAMNHADVAVYAVDTRGLVVGSSGVTTGGRSSVPHAPTGQDSMVHLADRTGGTVVKGTNDVATALTKVLEDAGVVYTLGFYPDEKSLDRKFHDLRVHVKRPGVEVNHRKAYFASEPQPPSEEEVQAKIRDFSISPFDAPGIGLAVQVAPGKKADAVQMSVGFELSDVALEHQNDRWKGAADLVIVEQAKDGHALTLVSETFNFDMTEEAYRARLRNGVSLAKEIPMLPGLYQLRVLVADRRTGRIGSLRVFPPKPD